MTNTPPEQPEDHGRIVQFRPRTRPPVQVQAFSNLASEHSPVDDLAQYSSSEDRDEYVHRMKMNAIAVVFLAALVGGGIWIVDIMAQQRKNQDCALSGRRNCAVVVAPTPGPRN